MRVRIRKPAFRFEFEGSPAVFNDLLRPFVGGPEAPPDPVPPAPPPVAASAPATAPAAPAAPPPIVRTYVPAAAAPAPEPPAVRTWYPPREPRRRDPDEDRREGGHDDAGRQPWRRRGGPEPEVRIEPSSDPRTLYERLAALESRRAEKDAVLAAVWFVGRDEREVHEKEVEKHLAEHGGPVDVKIRPHFLKHINRTKYFEPGAEPGLVRLSRKGREQIRLLCGV